MLAGFCLVEILKNWLLKIIQSRAFYITPYVYQFSKH